MSRRFLARWILPVLAVFVLSGCTVVEGVLQVRRDGAGVLNLNLGTTADARARYDQISKILGQLGLGGEGGVMGGLKLGAPGQPLISKAEIEALARDMGPDVRVKNYRTFKRANGVEGVEAALEFPDIRRVRWTAAEAGAPGQHRGGLSFDFVPGAEPILKIVPIAPTVQAGGFKTAAAVSDRIGGMPLVGRMLANLVADMRVRLTVRTESPVRRTNASPAAEGNAVTLMQIDAKSMQGGDVPLLFGLRTLGDLGELRRRKPAGMVIQDPGQVLMIQMAAPGTAPAKP